jgi:hypothetical protein
MASNYYTDSGTDLDNIFSVTNSNAGALGFKVADGQDLGNRYPAGSLGREVGFKIDNGTDIGYLRGASVSISGNISATPSNTKGDHAIDEWDQGESNSYNVWAWCEGVITANASGFADNQKITDITYTLQVQCPITRYCGFDVNSNSTTIPNDRTYDDVNICEHYQQLNANTWTNLESYTKTSNFNSSVSFAFNGLSDYDQDEGSLYLGNVPSYFKFRITATIRSAFETKTITTNAITITCIPDNGDDDGSYDG